MDRIKISNMFGGISFIILGVIPMLIQVKPFNTMMCVILCTAGIFICRSKKGIFL